MKKIITILMILTTLFLISCQNNTKNKYDGSAPPSFDNLIGNAYLITGTCEDSEDLRNISQCIEAYRSNIGFTESFCAEEGETLYFINYTIINYTYDEDESCCKPIRLESETICSSSESCDDSIGCITGEIEECETNADCEEDYGSNTYNYCEEEISKLNHTNHLCVDNNCIEVTTTINQTNCSEFGQICAIDGGICIDESPITCYNNSDCRSMPMKRCFGNISHINTSELECIHSGTPSSDCVEVSVETNITNCSEFGQVCDMGECIDTITCFNDSDCEEDYNLFLCNDNSILNYSVDYSCINPGNRSSYCNNNRTLQNSKSCNLIGYCYNGTCNNYNCSESDGGLNYSSSSFVEGYFYHHPSEALSGEGYDNYTDFCHRLKWDYYEDSTENKLREFYCENQTVQYQDINCENFGKICEDNMCKETTNGEMRLITSKDLGWKAIDSRTILSSCDGEGFGEISCEEAWRQPNWRRSYITQWWTLDYDDSSWSNAYDVETLNSTTLEDYYLNDKTIFGESSNSTYLRYKFNISKRKPYYAQLCSLSDEISYININGNFVMSNRPEDSTHCRDSNLENYLKKGENIIAVETKDDNVSEKYFALRLLFSTKSNQSREKFETENVTEEISYINEDFPYAYEETIRVNFPQGWNLVSLPVYRIGHEQDTVRALFEDYNVAMTSSTSNSAVWGINFVNNSYYSLSPNDRLIPGNVYWVYFSHNTTWEVSGDYYYYNYREFTSSNKQALGSTSIYANMLWNTDGSAVGGGSEDDYGPSDDFHKIIGYHPIKGIYKATLNEPGRGYIAEGSRVSKVRLFFIGRRRPD